MFLCQQRWVSYKHKKAKWRDTSFGKYPVKYFKKLFVKDLETPHPNTCSHTHTHTYYPFRAMMGEYIGEALVQPG